MLDKVLANQAEQIAVTPDQAAFVLKNKSDFKNKLDVDVSMYNTNIANSFINNKLQNNPDWNKYLQDPFRRNNPDYKRWKSVEDLMSEQESTSIAEKYGDNLAKQADIVLDYVKPKNIWDRTAMGYNAARYGLRYAAARKDLSDALEDGDETKITEARNKLQEELFNLKHNSYEFENDTLNTGASIAASMARNLPSMIVSDLAITAASGLVSGGVGAVIGATRAAKRAAEIGKATQITAEGIRAARLAKKTAKIAKAGVEAAKTTARGGIVFGDTYKIESGSILQELDMSHPELTEDQKRDLAHAGGIINAAIETIPMVMGVGFQAGMSKVLSKATTNAMLKTGVSSKVVSNPTFLREFKKQVEKNAFSFKKFTGDVAIDMASNSIQEVLQDCIHKATEYVIENPDLSVLEKGWDLFTDFIENPLAERNAELAETFLNVMIVSPFFSGAPTIVDATIKQFGSGSMYNKAAGAQKNKKLADDLNKWAKDNEVNSVAPATVNENLANMVRNGDAPSTVYFDVKSVQEALQSSEAEVQEAMQKLNMATRYEESKTNGGTIEMTLPEYNELVNQEKSGKLFQIVRSMVSFDPNSLSSAEFLRYMTTDGKALSVLEGAMEDSESAYNKAYNKFIESGWDEKQARFDATLAQLVSNRLASVTGGGMTGSEYFAKNIDIRTGVEHKQDSSENTLPPTTVSEEESSVDTGVSVGVGEPTKTEGGDTIVETTLEEKAEEQIIDTASVTTSAPENIMFDISSKESEYKNNFKKDGTIKHNVKARIHELFTVRDLSETDGVLKELFGLIGSSNSKWIKENVSSVDIVKFANKHRVSPTQIYRAVNIARGQPEARAPVVLPEKNMSKEDRAKTIKRLVEQNQGRGIEDSLNNLSDYELAILDWLDPRFVYIAYGGRLAAKFFDNTSIYVEKESLERTFSNKYGGVYYHFARAKNGGYYLWGNIGGKTIDIMSFESKEDMDKYQDEHTIAEITGEIISFITGKQEKNLKQLNEGISRKGKDYRNGKNVSAEDVKKRFGFRYIRLYRLDEKQEQAFLNSVYDSFSTLADTVGVPYSAMSLSGTLAITTNFGSHRTSTAWYDPSSHSMDFIVSKEEISKAVAHEWWHALDNYLAIGSKETLKPSGLYATQGFGGYDMRSEVRDAVISLMALRSTVPDFVSRTANAPSNKGYWSQGTERGARMFEQYVSRKLESAQEYDNLLTDSPEWYNNSKMWLTTEEEKTIKPYFDRLFKTLKTEQTESGNTRLFQKTGTNIVAGWFEREGDKLIVNLTKAVNPTTFSHEMFHAFSNVLMEQYNNGQLSKYWKRQAENLFESVGAKPDADGKVVLTKTQEEHLADQFTTYILEGKVPSAEVSSIFALIKDWFKKAYLDFGIRHLGLNKKVVEVFDSIFMAQEEVEQRQRALAMIEFPMPEGADQGLYDKYVSHLLNSRAKASAKLVRAWYAWQKKKQSKEYLKRRGDLLDAYRAELTDKPGYRYLVLLNKNNGDHLAAYNEFVAKYPEYLEGEETFPPEVIREIAESLPPLEEEVVRLADQQLNDEMMEEFKIDKEPAANKVLRNTEKVKALLAEALLHEGKKLSDFDSEYSAFLDNAERVIAKLSLSTKKNTKGIRNFTYWTNQEGMAVERYAYAYAQQDKAEMAQQRRNQALFTMIRIRGEEIDNRIKRFQTQFAEKLRHNQKPDIINKDTGERADLYTAEAWDMLQSIIEKFGFKIVSKARTNKTVAEKIEEWIAAQESKSMTTIGFARNYIPFIGQGYDGNFQQMSVNMFEKLDNIMTALNSVARTEQFVLFENEKIHLKELKKDVAKTFEERGIKKQDSYRNKITEAFGTLGKWTNPEPVLISFFSDRVLNTVFRPFYSAAAKAEVEGKRWTEEYRRSRDKIKLTGKKITFSNGQQLSDVEALDLFLSMGNAHAYENFRLKFELTEEQAEQVASEFLTNNPAVAEFVNNYWDLMTRVADVMNDSHKKRTNRILVKKEPRAFTINGIEFTGGYVPENKGLLREIENDGNFNSLQMGLMANEKEQTKTADGVVKSIVDNTENRLALFSKWAYAAPEYNNICKFMTDPEVKKILGNRLTDFIYNWLWSFQSPVIDTSGILRPLTGLVSVSALGFRVMQGLIQLSGLIPAIGTIGANYILHGFKKNLASGEMLRHPIKTAASKSDYMASRYNDPVNTVFGLNAQDIKHTKIGEVYQVFGMRAIVFFDAIVASAAWDGAYAKALAKGASERDAVLEADSAVRISQTDSMAASRSQAMQSPWARAINSFATYIMGMQSIVRAKLGAGDKLQAAQFAIIYIGLATILETMFRDASESVINEMLGLEDDDEDDKKYVERIMNKWYNDVAKTLGTSVLPAFNLGGTLLTAGLAGVEKATQGEVDTFEAFAPSSAVYSYLARMFNLAYNAPSAIVGDEKALNNVIVNGLGLFTAGGAKIAKEYLNQ